MCQVNIKYKEQLKRQNNQAHESRKTNILKTTTSLESTMTSITIAVSSCALFRHETEDNYSEGVAFPFVKALTMVNQRLTEVDQRASESGLQVRERFVIVLIPTSSQDMDHQKKNIKKYNLKIDIENEKPLLDHLNDIKPILYLSTNPQNVREAIKAGFGAATMFQGDYQEHSDDVLRVAFDGDGVLFSDESEKVYKDKGLPAFYDNEHDKEDIPLEPGPLSKFFQALVQLQQRFNEGSLRNCPIRTYLVTSRGTTSPGLRAMKTLQEQKLEINEAFFLSGAPKGPVLKAIKPHIFFDDQKLHIDGALENVVIGAHVPYGVRNE